MVQLRKAKKKLIAQKLAAEEIGVTERDRKLYIAAFTCC